MATRSSTAKRDDAIDPALPQKKRARRRLIGAAALCLLAAILLPLVFDSEPKQSRTGVQVSIPSRDTPVNESPAQPAASAPALTIAPPALKAPAEASAATPPAATPPVATPPVAAAAPDSQRPGPAKDAGAEPKNDTVAKPKKDTDAKSKPGSGKFLLQAGAYASERAATEQVERLRRAGQKAFTEKVKTDRGERIRVRAGPYPTREAAEKARAKLKAAGIEAALIAP